MAMLQGPECGRNERINQMVLRYERELFRICWLYLQNTEDAKDAVQETFLKAYRHLDEFRSESTEKTWLIRIAINQCHDMRRSAWFRYINHRVIPEDLPISVKPPCEESLALTMAIMRLPQKNKEVIILRYVQGLSVEETAGVLKITPSAVSARCKKAYKSLRDLLEEGSESEHD